MYWGITAKGGRGWKWGKSNLLTVPVVGSHGKGNEVSIFQKESPGETVIKQESNWYNWWLNSKYYKQCNNSEPSELCCGLKWNVNKCLWGGMRREISFIMSECAGFGFLKQVVPNWARLRSEKRKTWGQERGERAAPHGEAAWTAAGCCPSRYHLFKNCKQFIA